MINGFYVDKGMVELRDKLLAIPGMSVGTAVNSFNLFLKQIPECRTIETKQDFIDFNDALKQFEEQ